MRAGGESSFRNVGAISRTWDANQCLTNNKPRIRNARCREASAHFSNEQPCTIINQLSQSAIGKASPHSAQTFPKPGKGFHFQRCCIDLDSAIALKKVRAAHSTTI